MKVALHRYLVCPRCQGSLELRVFRVESVEVMDGYFHCGCGTAYPIIEGVPRLLPPDLLPSLEDDYPEFFRRYGRGEYHDRDQTAVTDVKRRTQEAFGYEWTWSADYHADNFRDWLPEGFDAEQGFRGKLGLEVGCGAGRHAAATARIASEHVAVDLSRAVDSAFARTRSLPNCYVVQADAMHLPFPERTFDYVYCLGVLQHMPDPEAGFYALAKQPRPGGILLGNVYQASRPVMLFLLECVRKITTRLSPATLKHVSFAAGILEYGLFIGPWRQIRATRAGRWIRPLVPDRVDESAKDDFETCVTDWFDRLACPIKKHYRREDLVRWYANVGYTQITVTPYWKAFWNGYGRRPAIHHASSTATPQTTPLTTAHLAAVDR
jgi:SAM-dependent methyltransferase